MTETNDKETQARLPVPVQKGKKRATFFIFTIGILSAVLGLMYIQMQHLVGDCMMQLTSLKEAQRASNVAWHDAFEALQQDTSAQLAKTRALVRQMNSSLSQTPLSQEDWRLFNARYYLELAHIQSALGSNKDTTLALLSAAETTLAGLKQNGLLPIREVLAKEIATTKAQSPHEMLTTLKQLQQLSDEVSALSFSPKASPEDKANIKTHWDEARSLLKQLVVVKYHDNATDKVQTPLQQTLLREIVMMNLKIAMWACIQENQSIYDKALQDIAQLLKGLDTSEPAFSSFITALQALQTVKFASIEKSEPQALKLLQNLLETRQTHTSGVQHD